MTTPIQPNLDPDWLARYLATRQILKTAMLTCVGITGILMLGAVAILNFGDRPKVDRDAITVSVYGQSSYPTKDELDAKRRKELVLGAMLTAVGFSVLAFIISLPFSLKYNRCPMCGKNIGHPRYFPTDKIHCPHCGRTLPENVQG